MKKKKAAIILGGGISGLSLAFYLRKNGYTKEICILEKSVRAGGWLESQMEQGFFFEKGPRTFRVSRSESLLTLIHDLHLERELLFSSEGVSSKYLFYNQKLQKVPSNPFSFLTSKLTRPLLFSLFREWKTPKNLDDESIHAFISRRFAPEVADSLFDAITTGIYGSDSKTLSISSCFPMLKKWEREYGSITKGLFLHKKKKSVYPYKPSHLFTLKSGVSSLINSLEKEAKADIITRQEGKRLAYKDGRFLVETEDAFYEAEDLFSAVPAPALAKMLYKDHKELSLLLEGIPYTDLSCVHFGYRKKVLPVSGFGYLVPSKEKEDILGVVFDSEVFSQQSSSKMETRLTLMLSDKGLPSEKLYQLCAASLHKHLGISEFPDYTSLTECIGAIPKYLVGHQEKINDIQKIFVKEIPKLNILGNYLSGASVNDSIALARKAAERALL